MTTKRPTIPSLLLITGVPGAGKSHFVEWLRREQNFRVLRVDESADLQFVNAILAPAMRGMIDEARAAARALGDRVVIEYGFPPGADGADPHVEALRLVGFDAWWFDADDYAAAFQSYLKRRGPTNPKAFHMQVARISAHRPDVESLFVGRMIMTLRGSKHLAPDRIWSGIVKAQKQTKQNRPPRG